MAVSLEGVVQRSHSFAIVDEVDSILIDEARTPLIISGEPETAAKVYYDFARVVKTLDAIPSAEVQKGIEPDARLRLRREVQDRLAAAERRSRRSSARSGIENLYDPRNVQLVNHLNQALKAQSLYQRDVDYVVQDGEVKIVDEFTGRIMEGRRWSEGLHQAVEAKEGVRIQEENVTLATITLQNYFRLYEKLAGMTGTAKTEEKEFVEIYDLHVVEIPTNVPVARADNNDFIFKTKEAKWNAVLNDIVERHEHGPAGARRDDRGRDVGVPLAAARRGKACRTTCSTRSSTSARRRSSSAPASPARSRSRRTWPAAASTSSSARACASSAASTCSAPSGTRRAGSTTSSAAAPAARATPARRASTSPARTISCACSRATGSRTS